MTTPDEQRLIEEIGHRIDLYSTALLRLKTNADDPQDDRFIGSGTFVSVDGQFGVLTAQHVAAELTPPCSLGLIIRHELHRFSIDYNYLTICELAVPGPVSLRPDIAFIGIHQPDVGTIKATKQFLNISAERDVVLSNMLPLQDAPWFIWGVAAEFNTQEPAEGGYTNMVGLHSACSATAAAREIVEDEHDYIDVEVEYDKGFDIPRTFGGYSGGGIWQVTIRESKDHPPEPIDFFFSGVTIYQSAVRERKRFLRCHGRRSIYKYAYNKIKNQCA